MPRNGTGAPVWRMRKADIIKAAKWKCKHSMSGLAHWNCYLKDGQHKERIGYLDIEASNLKADYGLMLSWCIKPNDSKDIVSAAITKKDLAGGEFADKRITKMLVKEMRNYDRVVTYYGTGFDLPFIRTRAVVNNVPFLEYGELNHTDVYYLVRNKFQLSSNRLENACRVILGNTNKTRIDSGNWLRALQGNRKAIAYILEHNEYDVLDLEELYEKIINYRRLTDLSI